MSTPAKTPAPAGAAPSAFSRFLAAGGARSAGLILAVVVVFVVGIFTVGTRFVGGSNVATILSLSATLGVLAVGQTFVVTTGGIDLSVGSVLGLTTVWGSTLATQQMANTYGWVFIVMTCLLVGLGAGLVNGILIAYGRVVPFIATLAMLVAARGVAEIIAGRRNQVLNVPRFDAVFGGRLLGVDRVVWIFLFVVVIGWFVLTRTTFGRRTIAVGGNLEAARLAGIKVRRHTMYIYALSGLAAGIAGVILLAKSDTGVSTNGQLMELDSIAAVVIGGTLLIGGRGTVIGTFLGVLLFQSLLILFSSNNLDSSVQQVAKGAIIVAAVLLQNGFGARDRRSG